MKYEKYEKPDLEVLELQLEGSFYVSNSKEGEVGGEIDENNPGGGDEWD